MLTGVDALDDTRLDREEPVDAVEETDHEAGAAAPEDGVSVNTIVAILLALVGLRIGLAPLFDNSFFTHLATGRLILDEGSIPTADPYSFTAPGVSWTVQSWGASVIFAGIEQAIGLVGIRILIAACCVALTQLVWRLTSGAVGLTGRLVIVVPVVAVGSAYWVERPLIFSLLFLMAVLFALEDRFDPRWLVPIMWAWVNVHGSFPMAFAAIVVMLVGRLLDRERPTVELRVLGWASLGTLLGGVLSPIGWRLLVFPAQLLERREAFARTAEWEPPTFTGTAEKMFLIQFALAVGLVLWRSRRWRSILPVVVFGALSFQASRNIVHASLIMVPAMAAAAAGLGTIDGRTPKRILRPVAAALIALFVLVAVVGVIQQPDVNLEDYPVESVDWMREQGMLDVDDRVVTRDFVGNYLEVKYGPDEVRVFFDDRVDMYPTDVIDQYAVLIDEGTDKAAMLEDVDASAVLWDTDSAFGDWIEDPDNGWTIVHRDPGWIVAVPPDAG
ncbi:hypothetical protein ACE2AJ_19285 [Aquihabitans daechungensis]|uniref:hypothetical protein n=1 Tax=Aquihabitans daechungensis TaxID=1052257 RepID=UPI003BA2D238